MRWQLLQKTKRPGHSVANILNFVWVDDINDRHKLIDLDNRIGGRRAADALQLSQQMDWIEVKSLQDEISPAQGKTNPRHPYL